ncbi:DNA repair exonuclease SbcCD nuclease subunit [Fontibacillus phaseoli]|uniref:DNA repair exonuclease SbcCD nuclease subunit n=1 Tax=Fontibacillus phaseoli TaxID=1416533 RepID=A0A369BJB4_9BACL|nr:DNA repair exonuclease [Fontibacillus phaseoli]RCX21692.1 DNA repair exonuclease SbcCD nuclease subunit [Fontibacillus phaseoli]
MTAFRFIHAADLHLDTPFTGMSGLPDRLRRHLQESTFAALGDLVDLAVSESADFLVISGDVYDASDSSLRAQLRLKAAWDKLAQHGIPVYVIHGNHDPLSSSRLRLSYPPNVTVFGGSRPESVTAVRRSDGVPVAVVSGISYPTASVTENTSLLFRRDPDSPLYHIAILHGNVDGQEGHDPYSPCSLRDLQNSGYDYWALGHIHKRQILSQSPWVVYSGNLQGRSLKETGPKGCYLVDVSENGEALLSFRELDHVRWTEMDIPIEDLATEEAWKERVEEKLEEVRDLSTGKTGILRFTFTGRGPLHPILQNGREVSELLMELQRRETARMENDPSLPLHAAVWPAGFKVKTGMDINRAQLAQEDSFLGELLRLGDRAASVPDLREDLVLSALSPLMEQRYLRGMMKSMDSAEMLDLLQRAQELASSLLSEEGPGGGNGT